MYNAELHGAKLSPASRGKAVARPFADDVGGIVF